MCARRGKPRLRLRHVGACHFTDREAVLGLPQLLLQHLDVAALQGEDRRVANEIHIGGRGRQQHGLLGQPQRFARRRNLLLGLPGARRGAETVEQRLAVSRAIRLDGVMADGPRIGGLAVGGGRSEVESTNAWPADADRLMRGR